jgi:hypothetical protein
MEREHLLAGLLGYSCPMTAQSKFDSSAGEKFVSINATMSLDEPTTTQVYGFWCRSTKDAKAAAKQHRELLKTAVVPRYLSFEVKVEK